MAISKEIFLAILTMDAYNRGYDRGLLLPGPQQGYGPPASFIGNAFVGNNSSILGKGVIPLGNTNGTNNDAAASFFAQAYTLNGETIISYRGTGALPGGNHSLTAVFS